jgi:hypothetical protein
MGHSDDALQRILLNGSLESFLAKPFHPMSLWNAGNGLMLLNRLAPESAIST